MKRHEPKGNKWLSFSEVLVVERSAEFSLDLDARAGAIGDWSTFGPHQEDPRYNSSENQSELKFRSNKRLSCVLNDSVQKHDWLARPDVVGDSLHLTQEEHDCQVNSIEMEMKRPGTR